MLFGIALFLLALWVVLAFVLAIPSGWAHVPLAVASVLMAVGIVKQAESGRSDQPSD